MAAIHAAPFPPPSPPSPPTAAACGVAKTVTVTVAEGAGGVAGAVGAVGSPVDNGGEAACVPDAPPVGEVVGPGPWLDGVSIRVPARTMVASTIATAAAM
jgi:hypothetical protein